MTIEEVNEPLSLKELAELADNLKKANVIFATSKEKCIFNRFVFNAKKNYLSTTDPKLIVDSQLKTLENEFSKDNTHPYDGN